MSEKEKILEKIRVFEGDVRATESTLKELREKLNEHIENTEEAERVAGLKEQLRAAQDDLNSVLRRDGAVNNLMEEIGAMAEVLKSQKFHLSNYLVAYFAQTTERQVELDEDQAREIVLTAKLGKEGQYQTSIFTAD